MIGRVRMRRFDETAMPRRNAFEQRLIPDHPGQARSADAKSA
jgi:hypothetical protein